MWVCHFRYPGPAILKGVLPGDSPRVIELVVVVICLVHQVQRVSPIVVVVVDDAEAGVLPNFGLANQIQFTRDVIHGERQQLVGVSGREEMEHRGCGIVLSEFYSNKY